MAICGCYLMKQGKLAKKLRVVATVMSNLGLVIYGEGKRT